MLYVLLKATPVTTPGRAIGKTINKLTVLLPKKLNLDSAKAASVPRIEATTMAPKATSTEFNSALRIASNSAAVSHHFSE